MEPDTEILKASDLSIGYKSKSQTNTIAENLNLNLGRGQLVALVGANGIGKSTLLRTITGIQKPLAGTVSLNGKDLFSYQPSDLAQNLSLVLTENLPPSNLTVFELIALGRQPYTNWLGKLTTEDLEKVNQAIALTNIGHLVDKRHYEISDGQLQIVLIARALAQDTPLIILDEPTTHLDLLHKVSVFKLLKKLSRETNKCILFSTHDIDLAIDLSDEMIVMTEVFVKQGSPCNMITAGVFDTIFKDESLFFDKEKGKFTFKNL